MVLFYLGYDSNVGMAEENYDYFVGKLGATEIATREALRLIENWVNELKPSSILEIGSGIGTITRLITKSVDSNVQIVVYEKNDWCRSRFWENITFSNIDLFVSSSDLLKSDYTKFDFCIVDDFLNQKETDSLVTKFKPKVIFIEGHRRMQQMYFAQSLYGLGTRFKYKNHPGCSDSYKGGVSFVTSEFDSYEDYTGISNSILVFSRIGFGLFYSKIVEIRSNFSFRKLFRV